MEGLITTWKAFAKRDGGISGYLATDREYTNGWMIDEIFGFSQRWPHYEFSGCLVFPIAVAKAAFIGLLKLKLRRFVPVSKFDGP